MLCGKRSAYIERTDPPFLAEVDKYYHRLEVVDDLNDRRRRHPQGRDLRLRVVRAGVRTRPSPRFRRHPPGGRLRASTGSTSWTCHANKGAGIRHIQEALGITRDQTMVFGDFLNDLEMMDEATYSFAMANAHPLLAAARPLPGPGEHRQRRRAHDQERPRACA